MTIQAFINEWNGQSVPSRGGITGQCVSLVQRWAEENGVSGTPVFAVPVAKDIPGSRDDAFVWVPNTPAGVPNPGDIVIFDGYYGGGDGHTGAFVSGDTNTMTLFEENDPEYSVAHLKTYNYAHCLGWYQLRQAQSNVDIPTVDNDGVVNGDGLRGHTQPNTESPSPWHFDDNEHITLIAKTQGENVTQGPYAPSSWWYLAHGNDANAQQAGFPQVWVSDAFIRTSHNPANVPDYVAPAAPPPSTYSVRPAGGQWGIDVSDNNGDIDWSKLQGVIDFAIIEAGHAGPSFGGDQYATDPKFHQNVQNATVPVGYYWYLFPALDPKAEAANFAHAIGSSQVPIFVDLEEKPDATQDIITIAKTFMDEVERLTGRTCHLYTYLDYHNQYNTDQLLTGNRKLWLADFDNQPQDGTPGVIHQYWNKGSLPGISGNVDLNYTTGKFSDLATAVPQTTQPIIIPIQTQPQPPQSGPAPSPQLPELQTYTIISLLKSLWQFFIKLSKIKIRIK